MQTKYSSNKPYWAKLQDPRWQKKRLEIMQRDGFSCVFCGDKTNKLNIHHQYYVKGREPWQYPDCCFKTVCDSCHTDVGDWICPPDGEIHENHIGNLQEFESVLISCEPFQSSAIAAIIDYLSTLKQAMNLTDKELDEVVYKMCSNYEKGDSNAN